MEKQKRVEISGIPMDLGQNLRGVDMGPSAVRYAELSSRVRKLGYDVIDKGNIAVPIRDYLLNQQQSHFLPAIVDILKTVYDWAKNAQLGDTFPIFLGGDHSICIGTIGGITDKHPCGVIYVDSHGDFNTLETSPSGNIHGMPLAALLGLGTPELVNIGRKGAKLQPDQVVLIGVRDLDEAEKIALKKSGITVYTMRTIDELGMASVTHQALGRLSHMGQIHLSFDMDVLDPDIAPGVGTPVPGGLTFREAHLCMEILADSKKVRSADFVEINPILDVANKTADMAVALITSLLGKAII